MKNLTTGKVPNGTFCIKDLSHMEFRGATMVHTKIFWYCNLLLPLKYSEKFSLSLIVILCPLRSWMRLTDEGTGRSAEDLISPINEICRQKKTVHRQWKEQINSWWLAEKAKDILFNLQTVMLMWRWKNGDGMRNTRITQYVPTCQPDCLRNIL